MLANGINPDLPAEDAATIAEMLVRTGRAVPATKWVESIISEAQSASLDSLF